MFGALWLWLATGATMTRFARGLGTPDYAFGILAAIPYFGTLMQLPASYLLDRFGRRKTLYIATQMTSRIMWVVVALIPWLWPRAAIRDSWPALIVVLTVAWAMFHLGVPAWMNWISDVVPRRVRGRFYGVRQRVARPIAIVATLAVGGALDLIQRGPDGGPDLMLRATSIILMVAGLFGILETLIYRRVHEPDRAQRSRHADWVHNLIAPLRLPNFRWFVLFNMSIALATGFMAQYIWLYLFDVGRYTNLQANFLLIALPGVVNLLVFPLWGRLVDRMGRKPVILIATIGMLVNPLGWILLGSGAEPMLGGAIVILGFMCWPGIELATMNYMLDLAGSRDEKSSGTAMVALNNIAVAVAGVASGLIGAVCARLLADFEWTVPGIRLPLTYHAVLLIFSALLRALAVVWASLIHDVGATPASDVIRYMTSTLYGNVRQAILMPTRVVAQMSQRAYRLRPRRGR